MLNFIKLKINFKQTKATSVGDINLLILLVSHRGYALRNEFAASGNNP